MPSSMLPTIAAPAVDRWPTPIATWEHVAQSGQFRVRVDLIRGVGRANAVPQLALIYHGGGHNGVFGLGWSLNIPTFSRGNGRQLPQYRDAGPGADGFSSTEFGEIVPELTEVRGQWTSTTHRAGRFHITRFRPRIDTAFARIERHLDVESGEMHWVTTSGDNVTRVFGRTSSARVADPENTSRVARWLLEEQRDSRGHLVVVEYKPEDLAAVAPQMIFERHRLALRSRSPQLHPKRVKWGNSVPGEPGDWLFELVFDYGEHTDDALDGRASTWTLRPDASSEYRDGFEVRTRRLCRRALLFQRIPELDDRIVLTRAHEFTYDINAAVSLMTGIAVRGYRHERDGTSTAAEMPAVLFEYAGERQDAPVRDITFVDGRAGARGATTFEWHDLDGSGLPGLLSREPGGALEYRRNLGRGMLGAPERLPSRPALTDTRAPAAQSLGKPFANARSCLVDFSEGPGYQERLRSGRWLPYATFVRAPSVPVSSAGTRSVDLDGDGRADLMLAGEFGVRWHLFSGRDGWDRARDVATIPETQTALADSTGTVFLADMSGSGLADLVQVRPGSVRYWPNLGYGRFGEPVQMANAPLLDAPDLFDPARIRLVDVNDSGSADLVYLGRHAITCYTNQCGNSFAEGRAINLPAVTGLDSVDVIDLLGTGTGCLVWSSVAPARVDRPLQYVELVAGRRPHLLSAVENGFGLRVEISYTTSTQLMLDDRRAGIAWHSTFPSPVWLATEVRETDHVSGVAHVMSATYRHGYYDDVERESRGFAFAEARLAARSGGGNSVRLRADSRTGDTHLVSHGRAR